MLLMRYGENEYKGSIVRYYGADDIFIIRCLVESPVMKYYELRYDASPTTSNEKVRLLIDL